MQSAPDLAVSSNVVEGCSPLFVDFEATSTGDVVWAFGDDNGATDPQQSHVYLGDPTVEWTTFDGPSRQRCGVRHGGRDGSADVARRAMRRFLFLRLDAPPLDPRVHQRKRACDIVHLGV